MLLDCVSEVLLVRNHNDNFLGVSVEQFVVFWKVELLELLHEIRKVSTTQFFDLILNQNLNRIEYGLDG